MSSFMRSALLFLALIPGSCLAQVPAPDVPAGATALAAQTLGKVSAMVSRSQFDQASALLTSSTRGAVVHVYVDWTPVPISLRKEYRSAVAAALQEWNAAISPTQRLEMSVGEEGADILLLFDR